MDPASRFGRRGQGGNTHPMVSMSSAYGPGFAPTLVRQGLLAEFIGDWLIKAALRLSLSPQRISLVVAGEELQPILSFPSLADRRRVLAVRPAMRHIGAMLEPVIHVDQLVKRYGNTTAVGGITFTVERGVTAALLGGNGAGKTTTLSILQI